MEAEGRKIVCTHGVAEGRGKREWEMNIELGQVSKLHFPLSISIPLSPLSLSLLRYVFTISPFF
jgi:hypothetical protein